MTPFTALLAASGLSQSEAAAFLNVDKTTISKWARGARDAPPEIIDLMEEAVMQVLDTANRMIRQAGFAPSCAGLLNAEGIGIWHSTSDEEARARGFICLSHEAAAIGLVIAKLWGAKLEPFRGVNP